MLERWLWTGPAGHLAGGTLDFAAALTHYAAVRLASSRAGRRGAAETHPAGAGAGAQQPDSRASR